MSSKKYSVHIKIWINESDDPYLGDGRILLLEKIKKTGSISRAAKTIKMSYRQAWQLVKDMNDRAKTPLVEKTLGGKYGGGTILTKEGERIVREYKNMVSVIRDFLYNIDFDP
jgi:molybdate transport system regulatory protein